MDTITFSCKTITPLLLHGADKSFAEFRRQAFKNAMRFWWRAINGDCLVSDLQKKEFELFGSTARKSPFDIEIGGNNNVYGPITVKMGIDSTREPFPSRGFPINTSFDITIRRGGDKLQYYADILKIALMLGGIGQRSRRGYGSISFSCNGSNNQNVQLNDILTMLRGVSEQNRWAIEDNKIIPKFKSQSIFPWIETIQIGGNPCNDVDTLLQKIANQAHTYNCDHTGYADKRGRFASPVYVTICKNANDKFVPVVIRLLCVPKQPLREPDLSQGFIDMVLA